MTDHCNARYSMALYRVLDAMRRSDPDYCIAHELEPCTEEQWDAAIELGEDVLDELDTAEEQRELFGESVSEKLYSCRCRHADHTHDPGCWQGKRESFESGIV